MTRETSEEMAKLASTVLNEPLSSNIARQLAGSALSQHAPRDPRGTGRQTGEVIAKLASKVLTDPNSSPTAKRLAGSVLSQYAE
ncbi:MULTISPECIES: hypothetical protein [unclassified Microcoleus]|uniref:hypothetical protein n=1 Tax=unclassified Microcoleus TaxID=2642155 RepID=UPI002FD55E25